MWSQVNVLAGDFHSIISVETWGMNPTCCQQLQPASYQLPDANSKCASGTSLTVRWLRLWAPNVGSPALIPGQELDPTWPN